MFSMEEEAQFVHDREDLIYIIRMRFGDISPKMIEEIYNISDLDRLDRLILVASNAPNYLVFQEEFKEKEGSFRLVGERFNPIDTMDQGDD